MIIRDRDRTAMVKRFAAKRKALKEKTGNIHLDYDERLAAQQALQDLPRDASPSRQQRRCVLCGRTHSVFRKFGLCRIHLREFAMNGKIPGIKKASW